MKVAVLKPSKNTIMKKFIDTLIDKYELEALRQDKNILKVDCLSFLVAIGKRNVEFLLRDLNALLFHKPKTDDKPSRVLQSHKTKLSNALEALQELNIDSNDNYYLKCYKNNTLEEIIITHKVTSTQLAELEAKGYDVEIINPKQAYVFLLEVWNSLFTQSLKGDNDRVYDLQNKSPYFSLIGLHKLTQKDIEQEILSRMKYRHKNGFITVLNEELIKDFLQLYFELYKK